MQQISNFENILFFFFITELFRCMQCPAESMPVSIYPNCKTHEIPNVTYNAHFNEFRTCYPGSYGHYPNCTCKNGNGCNRSQFTIQIIFLEFIHLFLPIFLRIVLPCWWFVSWSMVWLASRWLFKLSGRSQRRLSELRMPWWRNVRWEAVQRMRLEWPRWSSSKMHLHRPKCVWRKYEWMSWMSAR